MKTYKVVVTGPFNAGKTAFIRAVSDIDVVTTERRISDPAQSARGKTETTVAMDYGQKRVNGSLMHLYGTPGQERFEFMWSILAKEMDAFLLLVDSGDRGSLVDAKQIIRRFRRLSKVPYAVVANKQDGSGVLSPDDIRRLLALPVDIPVLPCVANKKSAVMDVLEHVQRLLA